MAESYKWLMPDEMVKRISDGASIPNDPGNRDWMEFQAWLSEGGIVQQADAPATPEENLEWEREQAVAELLTSTVPFAKVLRGVLLVALDEINHLRERDRDRSADVAAATSLGDLKTRWAARSALAERTAAQLKTAVENKIDAGSAD